MRPFSPALVAESSSIEAVIPVHDAGRPVGRTIRSIVAQAGSLEELDAQLKLTVVCHNIAVDTLHEAVGAEISGLADLVEFVEFHDGIYSPAGPKNFALRNSCSDFLTFVDSDDYLEKGALREWLLTARRTGAAAVLAPVRTPRGGILTTPRIRPSKPPVLDPVLDGLATRSLPHGLLRRTALELVHFRFTEGLRVGEDLEPTLRLLFSGSTIAYAYGSPAYRQTDDAGSGRVTGSMERLAAEFSWVDPLLGQQWIREAPLKQRQAIALKLVRIHGIGALRRRGILVTQVVQGGGERPSTDPPVWDATEQAAWNTFHSALLDLAGNDLGALSRRDSELMRSAGKTSDPAALARAVAHYSGSGRWAELMTARPRAVLSRNSTLRHYLSERRRRSTGVFMGPPADPLA